MLPRLKLYQIKGNLTIFGPEMTIFSTKRQEIEDKGWLCVLEISNYRQIIWMDDLGCDNRELYQL